jgi:HEAT repeat protein
MLALNELVLPLVELLDDPDSEVMIASIRALGEIGGDEARSALECLLDDGDIGDLARDALEMTESLVGDLARIGDRRTVAG